MLNTQYQYKLTEAGCDEVGRGCIAGPVVAAAVILPPDYKNKSIIDSKKLSQKKRKEIGQEIIDNATSWSISEVSNNKIDEINILNASILAMHRSLDKLKVRPEFIIVDGNKFKPYRKIIHECIIKGDNKFQNIAAASILEKNYRDDLMKNLSITFAISFLSMTTFMSAPKAQETGKQK